MGQVFIPGEIEKYELCVILYLDPKRRKKGMSHFFAYMNKLKHIKRWSLMRNNEEENVKEHSFDVAMIAHALAVIDNTYFGGKTDPERVMALALFHETGEVITGDLPTPVKYYNPAIRASYAQIENSAAQALLGTLPEDLREDYEKLLSPKDCGELRLVKAADKISALVKCVEERNSGNREFSFAEESTKAAIAALGVPEADIFLDEFLGSYDLVLDNILMKND